MLKITAKRVESQRQHGKQYMKKKILKKRSNAEYIKSSLLGASVRNSACGKGHEEEGSAYTKAGSSHRRPPVPQHLPPKPESACLRALCFPPILLILRGEGGAIPDHLSLEKVNLELQLTVSCI